MLHLPCVLDSWDSHCHILKEKIEFRVIYVSLAGYIHVVPVTFVYNIIVLVNYLSIKISVPNLPATHYISSSTRHKDIGPQATVWCGDTH